MSELKREELNSVLESVSIYVLTRLRDGEEQAIIGNKVPGELAITTLKKAHKKGWVLSEDYNQNLDTITEWKRLKSYIRDWKDTIEVQADFVAMTQEDIARIESGDLDEKMLPVYKENVEKWNKSLSTKRPQLKEAKSGFKSLKASIKSLKDKFELYISQLEVVE